MAIDILVVDDELDIRELVAGVLEDEGYDTRVAADSDSTLEAIATRRPSLVLLDVWLQGSRLDGLELLDEIKRRDPSIPVLVISGHGTLDTAVAAIRKGAADFIEKPFQAERLLLMVERATETERLRAEVASLRAAVGRAVDLTGNSTAAKECITSGQAPALSQTVVLGIAEQFQGYLPSSFFTDLVQESSSLLNTSANVHNRTAAQINAAVSRAYSLSTSFPLTETL